MVFTIDDLELLATALLRYETHVEDMIKLMGNLENPGVSNDYKAILTHVLDLKSYLLNEINLEKYMQ